MNRKSGLLLHISSLPSRYGIGKLGRAAFSFVDFLKEAGISCWQILPLTPTSYGDSPYQSFSVHAGNPYFIDFDALIADGLITRAEVDAVEWETDPRSVNYELQYENCYTVLRQAHSRLNGKYPSAYKQFLKEQEHWLPDYALFMALKQKHAGKPWMEWPEAEAMCEGAAMTRAKKELRSEIDFHAWMQFVFFTQWQELKQYANANGVEIIGDIPIYAALDSADVWKNPALFQLDESKKPTAVAGCPPDCFAKFGQLWGNPLYCWEAHAAQEYAWWITRLKHATTMYDIVRIDHFRGFESYYSIPYGNPTAEHGKWEKGPDAALFAAAKKALGKMNIIAEDLGNITPAVRRLLKKTGYPGMKVLQFAFDSDGTNTYLPHNFQTPNCVVYTGTHDNETLRGWVAASNKETLRFAKAYLHVERKSELPDAIIRAAWSSTADLAIAQMQDILRDGREARMNTPSTLGNNWKYRTAESDFTPKLVRRLKRMNTLYNR